MKTSGKKIQARTASTRATRKPDATAGKRQPKAKTAYELLERVCEHIREEPRRYRQTQWIASGSELQYVSGAEPPCGTVACRAGWIVALHDGVPAAKRIEASDGFCHWRAARVGRRAAKILDLAPDRVMDVFDPNAVDEKLDPGTTEYAREGVRGLRKFMRKHAAHLKARSLKGV